MSAGLVTACERLLSATANGVYQGILVAAIAGLTLRLFPRTNAATRHAVWFGVLLFVTALIPAHLLISCWSRPETPAATIQSAPATMSVALAPPYSGSTPESLNNTVALPAPELGQSDLAGGDSPSETASEDSGLKSHADPVAAIVKAFSTNRETAINLPHWVCLCLVSAWALLASVRGGLIFGRIGEVRRVKTTSSVPSEGLQTLFDRLRDSLAARRNVRLRISSTHRAAVVLGFIHPVVLLPAEMDMDANGDEVEHVLRHELAHVDRRDDWGNLAQQLIQAALFFHPAVWWISAKLSLEREIACDDHVLEASGQPRAYALTLANVASRMNQCRHLLAPGVSNNKSQLQQRITMILNTHRNRSPRLATSRLGLFTTATAILAVLAIGAGPRLVLAQSSDASETVSIAPPPEPIAPVAEVTAVTLPPDEAAAESGPIPKPPVGTAYYPAGPVSIQVTPSVAPAASISVTPAMPSMPELASADSTPDVAPVPPEPPAPRSPKRHMSVEERLDRIERILNDLESQDGIKLRHRSGDRNSIGAGQSWAAAPAPMAAYPKFDFQFKQLDQEAQKAAEQAQRAAEQAQRATEQAQRAAEAGQRAAELVLRDTGKVEGRKIERLQDNMVEIKSQLPLKELQALRDARDSLRKEMENLDRQIKHIEHDQNRPKDSTHGRSDKPDESQQPGQPQAQ
jgi:beta-lactamase regulating signal transducer with metallopeptidase domain